MKTPAIYEWSHEMKRDASALWPPLLRFAMRCRAKDRLLLVGAGGPDLAYERIGVAWFITIWLLPLTGQ